LPADGCTFKLIAPSTGNPINVTGSIYTIYGSTNGTYTYRVTDKYGCVQEFTFTVNCHFISMNIIRDPECGGNTTADLEFSNLPAEGWKIIPGEAGGSPTGTLPIEGVGTTYVLSNIARGDYTYEVYNQHDELISNVSVTVPYPGDGTTPSATLLNEDCTVKNTASIYLDHLPSVWTISIGTLIEQTGEGAFKQFDNVPKGTYSVKVLDRSTNCVSNSSIIKICE